MDWLSSLWEWLARYWETLTWSKILLGLLITVISIIVSYALIIIGMIKIPADYFSSTYSNDSGKEQHFPLRWGAFLIKNIIGFILIIAGLVMIVTPGPGIPTILLGLIMMDIPGKRPLEAKLIQRPSVLAAVNDLRARYNKPPLIMD